VCFQQQRQPQQVLELQIQHLEKELTPSWQQQLLEMPFYRANFG
jgi:hypothetical protein